jgi:hypothetical protein
MCLFHCRQIVRLQTIPIVFYSVAGRLVPLYWLFHPEKVAEKGRLYCLCHTIDKTQNFRKGLPEEKNIKLQRLWWGPDTP